MVKLEYKILQSKINVNTDHCSWKRKPQLESFQKELNALGEDDWDLVSVDSIYVEAGGLFFVAYLKRQKQ